jgi:hypothetical protein
MSSETLTERPSRDASGLTPAQFFLLLSMLGATAAVMMARDTHPAALLLLSAAVVSAGLVAVALHQAFGAFFGRPGATATRPAAGRRAVLEADKAVVLRSIKELEFDRAMGKLSQADFDEVSNRLRARALALMQELDAMKDGEKPAAARAHAPATSAACPACGTANDADARFCKQCGGRLAA